jgi:integrase
MPKTVPLLTATQVKALRKKAGVYNVGGDVPGLLLQVSPSGAASWILRATINGRVRQMGFGSYAKVPLEKARRKAREAHEAIQDGRDPIEERRAEKRRKSAEAAKRITFAEAAERYFNDVKAKELRNEKSRDDWLKLVKRHAYPVMGDLPVGEIERPHVLKVVEPLWPRPVGQYVRSSVEAVLDWSAVRGYREGENPAAWRTLKFVLSKPSKSHKVRHYAALPWKEAPSFLVDLRKVETIAAKALEYVILTAARSGEVRQATWEEIDLDARLWTIPEGHTKRLKQHRVPLSNAAIKLLESLPHRDGLLFPGGKYEDRELYDYELGLLKLGRQITVHGWRSSFKDWARSLGTRFTDEASELALAHVSSDATRAAYARDELLPERSRLMADWAEFLETGKAPVATVTEINRDERS